MTTLHHNHPRLEMSMDATAGSKYYTVPFHLQFSLRIHGDLRPGDVLWPCSVPTPVISLLQPALAFSWKVGLSKDISDIFLDIFGVTTLDGQTSWQNYHPSLFVFHSMKRGVETLDTHKLTWHFLTLPDTSTWRACFFLSFFLSFFSKFHSSSDVNPQQIFTQHTSRRPWTLNIDKNLCEIFFFKYNMSNENRKQTIS